MQFAGAMDKPVWILLPHLADWRWMQQTVTTPWYPSDRLIRQRARGDWAGVIDPVSGVLRELTLPAASGRPTAKLAVQEVLPEKISSPR